MENQIKETEKFITELRDRYLQAVDEESKNVSYTHLIDNIKATPNTVPERKLVIR